MFAHTRRPFLQLVLQVLQGFSIKYEIVKKAVFSSCGATHIG